MVSWMRRNSQTLSWGTVTVPFRRINTYRETSEGYFDFQFVILAKMLLNCLTLAFCNHSTSPTPQPATPMDTTTYPWFLLTALSLAGVWSFCKPIRNSFFYVRSENVVKYSIISLKVVESAVFLKPDVVYA